eukprot:TRINITY_DN24090_c0_g1_i1.p1 TRINITY_DN24090_c0_g1~~TRINITY_DN24090_c0_g1_i1.p1  ORF type:complete len:389 (+),score=83.15 TRINITY_DN24090_c0_g1_i1:138-1304(+)
MSVYAGMMPGMHGAAGMLPGGAPIGMQGVGQYPGGLHSGLGGPGPAPVGPRGIQLGGGMPRQGATNHQVLIERVKAGQRASDHWKNMWWSWCDSQGRGKRDPSKHSPEALMQAFHQIGDPPVADPMAAAMSGAMMQQHHQPPQRPQQPRPSRPMPQQHHPAIGGAPAFGGMPAGMGVGGWNPAAAGGPMAGGPAIGGMPPRRSGKGGGGGPGIGRGRPGGGGGPQMGGDLQDYVRRIKAGQRASEEWKARWWQWCDQNGGTKDPAKHNVQMLQQALQVCGDPPAGPPPLPPAPEPQGEAAALCQRIKLSQRVSAEFKAAWGNFCDEHGEAKRDPARHNIHFLQQALAFADPTGAVFALVQQQQARQQQQAQAMSLVPMQQGFAGGGLS